MSCVDTHEAKIKARLPARAHQPVQRGGGGDDWRQQEDAEAQRQELNKYAVEKRQREAEAQRQELERYAADKRQREAEDRRQREMDALRRENEEMRREMTEVKDQMQQKDKGCDIMWHVWHHVVIGEASVTWKLKQQRNIHISSYAEVL